MTTQVPIPPHVQPPQGHSGPVGPAGPQGPVGPASIPSSAVAGMVQAPTQVAQSAIDAFRGSPLLLAIILLNCLFVSVVTWTFNQTQERRHGELQLILGRCLPNLSNMRIEVPGGR